MADLTSNPRKKVALALQGGGSHGAFTWGVLERLLEEPNLDFVAISGTSAGAMNTVALANGLAHAVAHGLVKPADYRKAAIDSLKTFWNAVSDASSLFRAFQLKNPLTGDWNSDGLPFYEWLHMLGTLYSPYDDPSKAHNPLVDLLSKEINFGNLQKYKKEILPFYICATNVKTMQRKIFSSYRGDVSPNSVAASAALPSLFRAVEINGEFYWDGGFMGNPVISPLLAHKDSADGLDVLVVEVNPIQRNNVPTKPWDIEDRMNEVTFNSSMILELHAIEMVNKALDAGAQFSKPKHKIRFHHIPSALYDLDLGTKSNTNPAFLDDLRNRGRAAASTWIASQLQHVGSKTTYPMNVLDNLLKV